MKKPKPILDFCIEDLRWRKISRLKNHLEQAAAMTLASLPNRFQFPCHVTLLLTTNTTIRRLNRDFRGIDKPTNVLSFPQYDKLKSVRFGTLKEPPHMGDIAIAYQYIVDESNKKHYILIDHLVHLMIHGLLHLFGYDHRMDREANRMERLEKKIMEQLGRPDPYRLDLPLPNHKRTRPR